MVKVCLGGFFVLSLSLSLSLFIQIVQAQQSSTPSIDTHDDNEIEIVTNPTQKPTTSQHHEPMSCHLRELQICAVTALSFLQNPNGIASTSGELDKLCALFQESLECTNAYNRKCLMPTFAKLVTTITMDAQKFYQDYCKLANSTVRVSYLQFAPCYNKVQRLQQQNCLTQYQLGIEALQDTKLTQRLPLTCCNTNALKHCFINKIHVQCGLEAEEFAKSQIKRIFSRIEDVTCAEYEPSSMKCKNILPQHKSLPKNNTAFSRLVSTYANTKFNQKHTK